MKGILSRGLDRYRRYRQARAKSRFYKAFTYSAAVTVAAYLLTICFPHYLFANVISYRNFNAYSRAPLGPRIYEILDAAEGKLSTSPLDDPTIEHDMVFAVRSDLEHRTLSGTIAHEATHILIRRKYGLLKSLLFPRWKTEGYCEYVGGGSNLSHEVGMKRWRENPNDDSTYDYFKYYMMVSYLLDVEKVSVGDLFDGSYDTRDLESKVLR